MDYEHQPANHVAFRLADRVLLPDGFPQNFAAGKARARRKSFGIRGSRNRFTPRISSRIETLSQPQKSRARIEERSSSREHPPQAPFTIASRMTSSSLVLRMLGSRNDVRCVVLARRDGQRDAVRALELPGLLVPDHAADARSLMYFADLEVDAGGTMTREAAVLGIPTATVYQGRSAAIELELERQDAAIK
jgi:uncharacterized protein